MRHIRSVGLVGALGAALVVLLGAGCAELEKEKPVVVTTTGAHAVLVGQTIALKATTANGADRGYLWRSEKPAIATVDPATGVVKGVAPGETIVTATGMPTGAVGSHPVVVMESPASLAASVPYYEKWRTSAHADPTAEAFVHWRKEGAVPVECARCHSGAGFSDFVGGDGTAAGKVDKAAPESVITCTACHNVGADSLREVTFPSGVTVKDLGNEARCMTCHQGRASGKDVDATIAKAGATDLDAPNPMLRFTNIHYYPAAATLYASRVGGGYQYAGQVYDARFRHVPGFDSCVGCHDPHAAKPRFDACVTCHPTATDAEGARKIRMVSSHQRDYDGDGDVEEGVGQELDGLRGKLLAAITAYAKAKGAPICFGKDYPYWFKDGNGDGACDASETMGYAAWTPRLLKAAYNYQMATKDPGAFAHNAKYIMQLLFDGVTDLNVALTDKIDMARAVRGDEGHFDGASTAARRWDTPNRMDEKVEASCSRCHSGSSGFRFFVEHGVSTEIPETANGLDCATCHATVGPRFEVLPVKQTVFPSGVTLQLAGNDNLCSTCHSGREAKATIDAALAKNQVRFANVHYLPAGAVKQGSQAKVGYEYDGKSYAGPLVHQGGSQCTSCHGAVTTGHTFRIVDAWREQCQTCHADANRDAGAIRLTHKLDYDGDGNAAERLPDELAGIAAKLLAAMRAAAPGLCYAAGTYPYYFKNDPATGGPACTAAEARTEARFAAWTPALVKAAHNYQIFRTDPGSWAHNFDYMAQLLFDSTEALGGDVARLVRPAVRAAGPAAGATP